MSATAATVSIVHKALVPGSLFEVIADIDFGNTYLAYTFSPADFGLNEIKDVKALTMAPQNQVLNAAPQYDSTNNQIRLIVSSTGSEASGNTSGYIVRALVQGH